ncbi:hypothetical protein SHAM105786_16780 [Shewanella amazonensis]|uniref:Uncharacterized protein n=1 Tax=Shewanella amazonensis (strain ATCC BAA-1098 / SB2B) TaxID=326297 RepID=A1SAM6_SHEAM|nr:hypothetical protein [Shewanella amazonensis]ABM01433.1 hypothetical protein Sama_3230 [Shewanella amazonensis SB2B]
MNGLLKLLLIGALAYGGYDLYQKHYEVQAEPEVVWQSYVLDTVNISVMFPKAPTVERKSVEGHIVEWQGSRHAAGEYTLVVIQNPDVTLGDYYPNSLVNKGARLKDKRFIMVDGYDGYEFTLDYNDKLVTQRMISFHNAMVTQTAIYTDHEVNNGDTEKFLSSLSL